MRRCTVLYFVIVLTVMLVAEEQCGVFIDLFLVLITQSTAYRQKSFFFIIEQLAHFAGKFVRLEICI